MRAAKRASDADLVVDALAVHRITRLITADVLTQTARDRIVGATYARRDGPDAYADAPVSGWAEYAEADPDAPKLATLLTCRWCASVYVAAAVVALRRWLPGWHYVARVLAASSAAALLAAAEED